MTTPMRILSSSVRLTAKLDAQGELHLYHRGVPLLEHDDGLELVLESSAPATVEIADFEDATGRWTVTATGSASDTNTMWDRAEALCRSSWKETDKEVQVTATASNGQVRKIKVFFVRVLPEGSRPWS